MLSRYVLTIYESIITITLDIQPEPIFTNTRINLDAFIWLLILHKDMPHLLTEFTDPEIKEVPKTLILWLAPKNLQHMLKFVTG